MNLFGPPCHVLPSYRYENHARSHWILHEALVANRGSISNLGTHAENTENTVAEGFVLIGKKGTAADRRIRVCSRLGKKGPQAGGI